MDHRNIRTCRLLEREAKDPDKPVEFVSALRKYFLRLSEDVTVDINACRFCGGHKRVWDNGKPSFFQGGPDCDCGSLPSWAADPSLSIHHDEEMNEYTQESLGIFYYCIHCGGRMPKSLRATFFTQPSQAEAQDFVDRTCGLKSLEEVVSALGKPSSDFGPIPISQSQRDIYGMKAVHRQLTYNDFWDTLSAVFQEMEDGTLCRSYGGKYIKPVKRLPE